MQYRREKKKHGGDRNPDGRKGKESKGKIYPLINEEKSTAEKLAKQNGVSTATVKRDRQCFSFWLDSPKKPLTHLNQC